MSAVKYLTLSDNHVQQMSNLLELVQLDSLSSLSLAGNQIVTLVDLPVLEHLTDLDLSSNELTDVTELGRLNALRDDTDGTNLRPIKGGTLSSTLASISKKSR